MPDWIANYWLEWLFGAVAAALSLGLRSLARRARQDRVEQAAIKAGLQALLRAQMVGDFNRWTELGWAPIYARENFENCWHQYEKLGENGVMEDIRRKFLALPTRRAE